MELSYVRYQSSVPDGRGLFLGIFALANRLAKQGALSRQDWESWRKANDFYDAAYPTPGKSIYDSAVNPSAQAWFKSTATHLLTGMDFYMELLRRHDVDCQVFYSRDPGRILYEDDVQIVVVPH